MTLAVAHSEGKTAVLDAVREVRAPFSPGAVVEEFSELLHRYQVWTVHGDRYAGEWPREQFQQRSINYEPSELVKSELYLGFLPMLNSHSVALIEHPRLEHQLVSLERKVTRNGRDTIDHMRGAHDDIANAVAGACVLAQQLGVGLPTHRLQAFAFDTYDPFATPEENAIATARAEARAGVYFCGPGSAPTWHGRDDEEQQAFAITE